MKRLLMGLAVLPFVAGAAFAGQPLTDQQMDRVTAGFTATSIADALGRVGESGVILTTTGSLSQVDQIARATTGELTLILYKSVSAASSSSVTSTLTPANIPGVF